MGGSGDSHQAENKRPHFVYFNKVQIFLCYFARLQHLSLRPHFQQNHKKCVCVLAPKETSLFDYAVLKSMMHTVQYQLPGNYEHVCRVVSVSVYG